MRGRSAAASSSSDQSPRAWSKALVLDASDGSVASTPVSRKTAKSLAFSTIRARSKTSGCWSRTHMIFDSEYVGLSRCPVVAYPRSMPTRSTSVAACAVERVSAQMIAGRTGAPVPSSSRAPII